MNDRYLYRAKRTDNGEWITWNILTGIPHSVSILEDTVCACTGLKDKNGKLIWENDILSSGNLVVTWREELASYCLTKKGWMYQHFFGEAVDACDCEVIGNIFDNPELIQE